MNTSFWHLPYGATVRRAVFLSYAICLGTLVGPSVVAQTPAQQFFVATTEAMDRMMAAMSTSSRGDVDADFVGMMEPHHRGAIEMAELELRSGKNEQLRRIAQEIIVEQQQEIVAMRAALGLPQQPSVKPGPSSVAVHHH